MDPRNRADEALVRAQERDAFVVTPDSATSPMDASSTVRIPRSAVTGDPDPTVVLRQSPQHDGVATGAQDQPPNHPRPPAPGNPQRSSPERRVEQERPQPGADRHPPNPYEGQRPAGEFGPSGAQTAQRPPETRH